MDEKYYSERLMRKRELSMSLNKINNALEEQSLHRRDLDTSVVYVYFNKKEKVNKIKHPALFEKTIELEKLLKSDKERNGNSTLLKLFISVELKKHRKENRNELNRSYRKQFKEFVVNESVSLNFLAKKAKVSYSNLYNFTYKDMNTLSVDKMVKVLEVVRNARTI